MTSALKNLPATEQEGAISQGQPKGSELDRLCVNTIRMLALDQVENGTAIAGPPTTSREPMDVRIGYTIFPIEGDNPAPLDIKSISICRVYSEGPKQYMKCGGARYHVSNIGLQPKKEGN